MSNEQQEQTPYDSFIKNLTTEGKAMLLLIAHPELLDKHSQEQDTEKI